MISSDWMIVCEEHILNQTKKAFHFNTDGICLGLTNAKELKGVEIKKFTSIQHKQLNDAIESTNIGRFFNITSDACDEYNVQSNIKLRYTNIQTKSHEHILQLLKNEKMSFVQKLKKINVLFFQNIFNPSNMNYYMDHPDATMFDLSLSFLGDHKDTVQLQLYHYDIENKKKKQKMYDLLDFCQSKNVLLFSCKEPDFSMTQFEPDYSVKFRYTFDNYPNRWVISNKLSEEDQRVYSSYDDLVMEYEPQAPNVFSWDRLGMTSLNMRLNASLIDCTTLFMNQIHPLKHMCCFSDTFLKSHGKIIEFFKQ